ncbi:mannosyl-oligosaccharide alpha-1,2-mannosidase [Paramarasmius palmivorus]|uniref:alpha-1,2-Mannosidase n=1 Tax=Paramarasmius palmivorus TaxID=297713 RepID=A0AAW0DDC5_9AGAR
MSDSTLRKRKKDQKAQKPKSAQSSREEDNGNDLDFIDGASLSQYTKILWIPLVLALGAFIYLNPSTVNEIIGLWIESEDLQATSGSRIEDFVGFEADVQKRDAVVEAFKHAWRAYERDAMGADEYHPISHKGTNLTHAGGIGYTVIDSIDTMLMMGLKDDYERARSWVENKLSFERNANFNTFETTIRVLGGLLSAHHLSGGDQLYLEKAIDLADRILSAFDTPSGLPLPMINLAKRKGVADPELPALVSTAEAATLQLELRYLSHLTENEEYWEKAENVMRIIKAGRMPHGLASIYMHAESGKFVPSAIRLGSRGDSYYEYLFSTYKQFNQTELVYRDMYDDAMGAIHEHLIKKSPYARLTFTAELIPERNSAGQLSWRLTPKQDHLVCFLGGSLMLGATLTGATEYPVSIPPLQKQFTPNGMRDWDSGVALVKTCIDTHDTATGLSPEIAHFRMPDDGMEEQAIMGSGDTPSDWYIKGARPGEEPPYDARYILRPETVESLFLAFRLTGDKRYRKWGWDIFQAIEKHCRVPTGGYASIINVDEVPSRMEDKMETFLMSETLKYLYLLFEDAEVLPLDKYVLNTEAHPFPIFTPTIRTGFT